MTFESCMEEAETASSLFVKPLLRDLRWSVSATLSRHHHDSPQRAQLEDFVRREYLLHFGARLKQLMPELLALQSANGTTLSVVGCRAAAGEPLFLETYTREPVENVLARHNGFWVPRERIVEIGNLACRNPRAAVQIVRALVPYLLDAGFSWVVFTGADTVMNIFHRLGLAPRPLCPADPLLLGEERRDWGTYYDHNPLVMAGRIVDGEAVAQCSGRSTS